MRYPGAWLTNADVLACLVFVSLPAQSQGQCEEFDKMRVYGKTHFSAIKGGKVYQDFDRLVSKWKLPKAKECVIEPVSGKYTQYRCNWVLIRGLENELAAKSAYEAFIRSVQACAGAPSTLERRKFKSSLGESATVMDPFPGMRKDQERYFEVSYSYSGYWWSLDLEYGVNDEVEP